jgi:DNA-binding CsgD family transcriptional regulator
MDTLTARQQEVLDLWLGGSTYRELASALGISPETVNPHLKAIARKLGTTKISRAALREAWRSNGRVES